jgi:hypothetical protein
MIRFQQQSKLQVKVDMPFLHKHTVMISFSTEDTEKAHQQACQEPRVHHNQPPIELSHPNLTVIKMEPFQFTVS